MSLLCLLLISNHWHFNFLSDSPASSRRSSLTATLSSWPSAASWPSPPALPVPSRCAPAPAPSLPFTRSSWRTWFSPPRSLASAPVSRLTRSASSRCKLLDMTSLFPHSLQRTYRSLHPAFCNHFFFLIASLTPRTLPPWSTSSIPSALSTSV